MKRRTFLHKTSVAAVCLTLSGVFVTSSAWAADTIKVGVLHSLSGTMAISETVLKDVTLMAIDEINAGGGVLGKKLEAVVVDPASNWPLSPKARQLISQDKVAVVFGCDLVSQIGSTGVRGIERPAFPSNTKAKSFPRTSSTLAPRLTSRRSPRSSI
jgi:hypothetical protein